MSRDDWKQEMDRLMALFEHESTISLRKIIRCFEIIGQPFDEDFRQYFMKKSNSRLESTFDSVLLEKGYENTMRTTSSSSVTNNCNDLGDKKDNLRSTIGHTDTQDIMESNMKNGGSDARIEIHDSSDEKVGQEKQMHGNGVEADVKHEFKVEIMDEVVDLPIVTFDPNEANESSSEKIRAIVPETMDDHSQASGQNEAKRTDSKRFKCKDCLYASNHKSHFQSHRLTHGAIKPFKCDHCDYAARRKSHLIRHQQTHDMQKLMGVARDPNDGLFKCKLCDQRFAKWNSLKWHLARAHKNNQRLFNCANCMRRFPQKTEKDRHEARCLNRRFECYLCKKYVTKNKKNIQDHLRTHSGAKPFECVICMKCFRSQNNLRGHLNSVHTHTSS